MINSINLRFGRTAGAPPQTFELHPITVFVGPNNSGKSKVLSEIYQFCHDGTAKPNHVILQGMEFKGFSEVEASQRLDALTLRPRRDEVIPEGNILIGKRGSREQLRRDQLLEAMRSPIKYPSRFASWYLRYNTLLLNGSNRIQLVNDQDAGDLLGPPHNSLQVLFRDDERRKNVRRIVHDAFSRYFVIDPTHSGKLRVKLSEREPASPVEERGLHDEAIIFHSDALPIAEASDGVKAFTGIVTEITAGDPSILLIDEPEAFLHPHLAFKLGLQIANLSAGTDKRIFVATHSSHFVMGCVQSGVPVNIIRLTYRDGLATCRVLPNQDILRLMRNPLLRSTGVLNGLFYEFVVVGEADADRAFYQEINERLLQSDSSRGIPHCLFLNAQNKQTVQRLIRPLRELGIPAAGIVDIDVLKEGGKAWSACLESAFVPQIESESLAVLRKAVCERLADTGKDMKRDGGLSLLGGGDLEAAQNLLEKLSEYGIFVVPQGELEAWLPDLNVPRSKHAWLLNIFEVMGEDPSEATYLKPANDDVWNFIAQIKQWFINPKRKGIPA